MVRKNTNNVNLVDIVIVNYNSTKYLDKLITSTNKIKKIIDRIYIIDNNSIKKPKYNDKKIKTIFCKTNIGFAKAVNIGLKKSKKKYVLLLNPDTTIIDKSIIKMFSFLQANKDVELIGGKIVGTHDNKIKFSANNKPTFLTALMEFTNLKKIFPNNCISKKFWPEKYKKISNPTDVYAICGAFMIIKNNGNRFDENFFMYLEDLDLGLRIKQKGKRVIFFPDATIKHVGGASSNSKYKIVLKYWYESRRYFFKKYLSHNQGKILEYIFMLEEKVLSLYHNLKNEPSY